MAKHHTKNKKLRTFIWESVDLGLYFNGHVVARGHSKEEAIKNFQEAFFQRYQYEVGPRSLKNLQETECICLEEQPDKYVLFDVGSD